MKSIIIILIILLLFNSNIALAERPPHVDPVPRTEWPFYMVGDVDYDGVLTMVDAFIICAYLVGMYPFDDLTRLIADYNHNGIVDIVDALLIARATLSS